MAQTARGTTLAGKFSQMLWLDEKKNELCLDCSRQKLTGSDLQHLCQSIWPKRFRELRAELWGRLAARLKVTGKTGKLTESEMKNLFDQPVHFSYVDLSENRIGSKGVEALVNFLWKKNIFVRQFWLHKNEIGCNGLVAIAEYLDWTYLKCWLAADTLEHSGNAHSGNAAKLTAPKPSLRMPISELHLSHNSIQLHGFLEFAKALAEIPRRFLPSKPIWVRIGSNQIVVDDENISDRNDTARTRSNKNAHPLDLFSSIAPHLREVRAKALRDDKHNVEPIPSQEFRVIREVTIPESRCWCAKINTGVSVCPECGRTKDINKKPLAVFRQFQPQKSPTPGSSKSMRVRVTAPISAADAWDVERKNSSGNSGSGSPTARPARDPVTPDLEVQSVQKNKRNLSGNTKSTTSATGSSSCASTPSTAIAASPVTQSQTGSTPGQDFLPLSPCLSDDGIIQFKSELIPDEEEDDKVSSSTGSTDGESKSINYEATTGSSGSTGSSSANNVNESESSESSPVNQILDNARS